MKSDIERLMSEQGVDAIWITGSLFHNPDMVYFTGVQHVMRADLFKVGKQPPILYFHNEMEREEAARSGLEIRAYDQLQPLNELIIKHQGDVAEALAERISQTMRGLGLQRGRVAVGGQVAFDAMLAMLEKIKVRLPEVIFIGFYKDGVIKRARMTKDTSEVEQIRSIGQITAGVVARTAEYLTSREVQGEFLLDEDGLPLTTQRVKMKIRLWLAEEGADNPLETIFSVGRDTAIPHNTGNPQDPIRLGEPIIFDIFPCLSGGGYFYDMTRTWCLGFAPPAVADLYAQVMQVFQTIRSKLSAGAGFRDSHNLACRLFKKQGHPTIQENYNVLEGYVHNVGHGIGLNVHERPFSGVDSAAGDQLLPGVVFSLEPGLYYPSENMGVRIEDTLYLNPQGEFEVLAPYPYDLVLPMRTI